MSVPSRRDELAREENDQREEQLTTADLAQGKRPPASETRMTQTFDRTAADSLQSAASVTSGAAEVRGMPENTPLFPSNELGDLRDRWSGIQTAFVDEPRRAVEEADGLVASAMKRLAEIFAQERSRLEEQWDRGDNISTEDLRLALQRYRSFFHRLLAV